MNFLASSCLKTVNACHNFTRVDFIQKSDVAFSNRISTIKYQFCRRRNYGQFTNTTCVKKISPGSELKPHFVPQTGNISDPSQDRNRKQQPESNREITFSVQLALLDFTFPWNSVPPRNSFCSNTTFHCWELKKFRTFCTLFLSLSSVIGSHVPPNGSSVRDSISPKWPLQFFTPWIETFDSKKIIDYWPSVRAYVAAETHKETPTCLDTM